MKPIIVTDAYVEARLAEWGEWFSRGIQINIGFPNKNILARMREEGGQIIRATGPKPLMANTKAEEMEEILMSLNTHQPVLAHVLMITYLYPESPVVIAEKKFGYKKSNYYKQFNIGFAWIKGYLIAKMGIENCKKNISKKSFTNCSN